MAQLNNCDLIHLKSIARRLLEENSLIKRVEPGDETEQDQLTGMMYTLEFTPLMPQQNEMQMQQSDAVDNMSGEQKNTVDDHAMVMITE